MSFEPLPEDLNFPAGLSATEAEGGNRYRLRESSAYTELDEEERAQWDQDNAPERHDGIDD